MTLNQFIRRNRAAITAHIRKQGHKEPLNDNDRADWVMKDEYLYRWATRLGVKK